VALNGHGLFVSVEKLLQGKRWSVVKDWLAIGCICQRCLPQLQKTC
jgi:hypothetical protein